MGELSFAGTDAIAGMVQRRIQASDGAALPRYGCAHGAKACECLRASFAKDKAPVSARAFVALLLLLRFCFCCASAFARHPCKGADPATALALIEEKRIKGRGQFAHAGKAEARLAAGFSNNINS